VADAAGEGQAAQQACWCVVEFVKNSTRPNFQFYPFVRPNMNRLWLLSVIPKGNTMVIQTTEFEM
jgi:hypothetical protein